MIRSRWAGWKFETPTDFTAPSVTSADTARQVETKSPSYCVGSGQWMRNRSTCSRPSLVRDSSKERRTSSGRWLELLSLVVM